MSKFPSTRNYINHGSKNGDDGAARGFSIETLPATTSFKLGKLGETKWCNGVNPPSKTKIYLDSRKRSTGVV